jgi:hypothetical protein
MSYLESENTLDQYGVWSLNATAGGNIPNNDTYIANIHVFCTLLKKNFFFNKFLFN